MTNDEIEQFASDLYQLALDGDYFGLEDKGAAKLRELVSRAYEEAARAQCEYCAADIGVVHVSASGGLHGAGLYHPIVGQKHPFHRLCKAAAIRALKDSLVREPAPSR